MAESRQFTARSNARNERIKLKIFYLKSPESMEGFIHKLQQTVKIIDSEEKRLQKDDIYAFGDHNVSFSLMIESSLGDGLVTGVLNLWEVNKHQENLSWVQFLPVERKRYKTQPLSTDRNVELLGGSMISPTDFVKHWEKVVYVEFQPDRSRLMVGHSNMKMEINISHGFLHNCVILHLQNSYTKLHFNVKSSPKLFMYDDRTRMYVRIPASRHECRKFGYLDSFCLKLKNDSPLTSAILSYMQYLDFDLVYTIMNVANSSEEKKFSFAEFELSYALKSLCSRGFKVIDHLSHEVVEEVVSKVPTQIIHTLADNVSEKPFFHFANELHLATEMTKRFGSTNQEYIPPNYTMIRRVLLTPSKCIYQQMEPVFQNRIVRQYNKDYFVRLVYRDDDFEKLCAVQSDSLNYVLEDMKKFFVIGFDIHDRHYEFLGCSNSQLREHSFWFFSSYDGITADFIREKAGDLSKERCVASYVYRFGLCFSASCHTLNLGNNPGEVQYEEDVKRDGFNFTDGIGKISPKLAKQVAKKMNLKVVPSAFQIRYGGCKGVVALDPSLGQENEILVIRESMKKFESTSRDLEVLTVAHPGRLHLNRQVITLLSGLGIPDEIFQDLQEAMLIDLSDMLLYDEKALLSLKELFLDIKFEKLLEKGISFIQEPFFRSLLLRIFYQRLDDMKKRTRIQIPLNKGRYMMGTSDESKQLNYGQVFIQYSKETDSPMNPVEIVQGKVVVTKKPCFHPGDIRVFEAVKIPSLKHMVDCIVFPQLGPRPHSDEMSGSDHDGDEYFVCWDERLTRIENLEPMEFPQAEKTCLTSDVRVTDIVDFLANYIKNDNLGIIANSHLALADNVQEGIFSNSCLQLAKLHSDAVNFPKTGKFPHIQKDFLPQKYPDFMIKADKIPYFSSNVLGKLYRQCQAIDRGMRKEGTLDFTTDQELTSVLTERETQDAISRRDIYNGQLLEIMNMYGLENESEAITGMIQTLKHGRGCLKDEKFQIGKIVREKVSLLRTKTRNDFFREFGAEKSNYSEELEKLILKKASAWYTVTYETATNSSRDFLSFPWVVADILCLRKKTHMHSPINEVEQSVERRIKLSEEDRSITFERLQSLRRKVKRRIPQHVHSEWISFAGNDVVMPWDYNQILGIKGKYLENVLPAIEDLRNFASNPDVVKIDPFNGGLCYRIKLTENVEGCVTLITDENVMNLSITLNYFLSKHAYLKLVAQFLLEYFRKYIFSNVPPHAMQEILPVMFLRESSIEKSISDTSVNTKVLLNCFRNIRRYIQNIFSNLSGTSLQWLLANKEDIVEACVLGYINIACHLTAEFLNDADAGFVMTESIILPTESWATVKHSTDYAEIKLMQITGADVYFRETDFEQHKGLKLEASGTNTQLVRLHKALYDVSVKSKDISISQGGQTTVDGAFSVSFEGCKNEDEEVSFLRHNGPFQKYHANRNKFIPCLSNFDESSDWSCFQRAFMKQWTKLKNKFVPIFHGDLSIALVFGTFYIMPIQTHRMSVSELNTLIAPRSEREGSARTPYPCTFSFYQTHRDSEILKNVLETKFLKESTQRKVKVRMGKFTMFDLDEHLNLMHRNLPEIKWFIHGIIRKKLQQTNRTDVRCKIQSYRNLNREDLQQTAGVDHILERCSTNEDNFVVKNSKVTYIREKTTDIYLNRSINIQERIWCTLRLEVSTVKEHGYDFNTKCWGKTLKKEVAIIPYVPDTGCSDEEMRNYSKHLWDIAMYFGDIFDE